MKKRKTYEISLIDKTYSKTISDETKFYTSDTSLELVFKLKETEYTFESAEIVFLNINDKSLITRRVVKSDEGFVYTFEKDVIAHYGEWKAQLMFIENVDAHVASPIKFRIENDLYNTKPQALSDVVSWVNLKLYAEKLVGEFKQAVDEAFAKNVEIENTFKTNEQNRQTAFETNESERDRTFESNETTRQAQELEREKAEGTRQTVFEVNEASRDETFNTNEATRQENETTRQQAEGERESAESNRASAEEQRKIDHADRSAELAGKANKKQEDWITPTLLNGWTNRSPLTPVRFRKNEFGTVEIEGAIKGGTLGTSAFVLPLGYRVGLYYPKVFGAPNYEGLMAEVAISGGNFTIVKSSTTIWISLEGISYVPN